MKGTKRRAIFDSSSQQHNDFSFPVNQTLDCSFFDGSISAELDVQRAASSQQHVRALNNQFASWIQRQLKEHPDELWEDGVRDYLSHASNLLEKFSDVVKWLKENPKRGGFGCVEGSHIFSKAAVGLKTADFESDVVNTNFFQGNTALTFATPFVMPAFASKETKSNLDNMGLSQGNSVITSPNLKLKPDFGSKVAKLNTSGESADTFTGNSSKSCGAVMLDSASKDTNTSTSGSFFSGNSVPGFGNSKLTIFGSKETIPYAGSVIRNSAPSFGISKSLPDFGSKDSDTNTSGVNGIKPALFDTLKVKSDSASNEEPMPTHNVIGVLPVNSAQVSTFSLSSGAPLMFGNKSPPLVNTSESNDHEDENEPEQPSSPSLKKFEEEGITVVHEVKCKLYVKSPDPADKDSWKDKGMGNLSIKCREGAKRGSKECKPTIVVRNDVGRLLLNALIYPGIKTNLQKNSIVAIFHTSVDGGGNDGACSGTVVARIFLIRTKTEEDRDKLAAVIQECAPPF